MSLIQARPATVLSSTNSHSVATSSSRCPEPKIEFDSTDLSNLNHLLSSLSPQEIVAWAIDHLPGLYQTTAFGLTGCATLDMISKISKSRGTPHLVDVIFIDTLYHFRETLNLAKRATERVDAKLHTYHSAGADTTDAFESILGERFWEADEESYDFLVKVEPGRRAYDELSVRAVFTGRRRSQGADRATIPILEVDETGLVKVNPLAAWSFQETWDYIEFNNVPYNPLIDRGYKSIGDWHSTATPAGVDPVTSRPSQLDSDERSGRWSGKSKTECGLHKDYFKMKRTFEKKKREKELAERDERRDDGIVAEAVVVQ